MVAMYKEHYFQTEDGLKLYLRDYQAKNWSHETYPVICLPGLSRNSRDFDKLAQSLSHEFDDNYRVITLDYRGRGNSDWDDNKKNYNIIREAQDVLIAMEYLGIPKAHFIGTSRGGLILHILATMKQDALASIVFNDIGPRIELKGLLEIQQYLSKARLPKNWDEAADLQKAVHGHEFLDLTDADWQDMAREIYIEKDGIIKPDFDPAVVESIKTLDESTELPTMWDQFALLYDIPVMTIRGENSTLFTSETLAEMDKRHPNHTAVTVQNQGHPPLLQSGDLPNQIYGFIKSA